MYLICTNCEQLYYTADSRKKKRSYQKCGKRLKKIPKKEWDGGSNARILYSN